ncbi:MAG: class II aldolase/adducin family protein [Opitutaceae bacterium]
MIAADQLERQLIETGREMLARQPAWGASGNLSARTGVDSMVASASGIALGAMSSGDFVAVRVSDGHWEGARKPSKELPMHLGIYRQREDARVVLHSSPPCTTLIACSHETIPSEIFVEAIPGHVVREFLESGRYKPRRSRHMARTMADGPETANYETTKANPAPPFSHHD